MSAGLRVLSLLPVLTASLHLKTQTQCAIPPGMTEVRTLAGFSMVVLSGGDIVSDEVRSKGWWDLKRASDLLQPQGISLHTNGTFLDVGGNLGYYSLLFAQAGYNVLTVEPMTRNLQAIEASLCLNPHLKSKIKVLPFALVSPSQVAMKCFIRSTNEAINRGNGHLQCGMPGEVQACAPHDGNCDEVVVKTLDAVLAEVKPSSINVVKMDIETYECKVLEGGQSLFTKYLPQLLKVETMYSGVQCWNPVAGKYGYHIVPHGTDSIIVKA